MFALLLAAFLDISSPASPEPPLPLEARIVACNTIEWSGIEYPIVFCRTGIVWAPWSPTHCYTGHWAVCAGVLTITWTSISTFDPSAPSHWEAPPLITRVKARKDRLALVDASCTISLHERTSTN